MIGLQFPNLLAANGLSKLFADGKYTGDSRFSGARGCSPLDGAKRRNLSDGGFLLSERKPRRAFMRLRTDTWSPDYV